MNIEKLQMCRLCLVEDVRMFNVTNKDLQTLYEKLTDAPFVTEDSRPMLACVFCYTKLKQCCQLQRKCLEAEKMLTEMLNKGHETKPPMNKDTLEYFSGYVISPTVHVNCVLVEYQLESNDIKEELPVEFEEYNDINEIKEEYQPEPVYLDRYPDLEDIPVSEDDTPLIKFKVKEEPDTYKKEQSDEETQSAPGAIKKELYVRITGPEDTTTAQHKKTERNTQKRTTRDCSKLFKVNNTAIATKNRKLKQHNRKHTGEKPYKCEICQKSFNRKQSLVIHNRIHTGEKPYKCETCLKSFSLLHHLKEHNRKHTGEKPYKCEICQKSFNRKQILETHNRIHTGEKPYKCETCLKSFSHLQHFKEHNRTHTGEKPYKCETCQKTFNELQQLKQHNRIHTGEKPYKCEICQKSFNRKQNLEMHNRIHTGEKPYKCETCLKSFSHLHHLKQHNRIHTGEK